MRGADTARTRDRQEIEELAYRLKRLQEEREDTLADLDDARAEVTNVEQNLGAAKQALEIIQAAFQDEREQGQKLEETRLQKLENIGDIKKEEERLRTQLEYNSRRHGTIADSTENLTSEKRQAASRLEEMSKQKDELQSSLQTVEKEFSGSREAIEVLRDRLDARKAEFAAVESKLSGRKERLAVLRQIIENMDDYPEGVRYLLDEKTGNPQIQSAVGDVISVESKYRPASEAALSDAAVSLIVDSPEFAVAAIEELRQAGKSAVTFFPLSILEKIAGAIGDESRIDLSAFDGVLGNALDFVKTIPKYQRLMQSLLRHFWLVESFKMATQIRETLGVTCPTLVTLSGDVLYTSGAIRGGGATDAETSLVGRKAIVQALETDITGLENSAVTLKRKIESDSNALREKLAKSESLQSEIKERSVALHNVEIALNEATGEVKKIDDRLAELASERQHLDETIAEYEEKLATLAPTLKQIEADRSALEDEYKKYRDELAIVENELKEKEASRQKIQVEIVTREAAVKNIESSLQQLERNEGEIEQSKKRREEEIIANTNRIEALDDHIAEVRESLQAEFAERKKFEDAIAEIETVYSERKIELDKRDKALRSVRQQRDTLAEEIHQGELRIAELKMNGRNLIEQIQETYEVDLNTHPVPDAIDTRQAAKRINDLKNRIRSMGPVNMLALKDYETEKERHDFLITQKEDLLTAEENLKETIRVINNTAYERFDEVFSKVRENFIRVFKSFFPNGIADISLSGDDPLEADIVIDASPKG